MRVEHKSLVLGVTLAGAIAGAMTVHFGGFVDRHTQAAQVTAVAQKVAGANEHQKAGPRYELSATNPAKQR
jgi:hypothetical protein